MNKNESGPRAARISRVLGMGRAFVLAWPRDFDFAPGQLVELSLEESGESRLYSLFTGPGEAEAGVLFTVVEGGALTPDLARLSPGRVIRVGGPSGSFPALEGRAVWIANGTGVAPFLSMARAGLARGKALVHGARQHEDFYFCDELLAAMGDRYVRCLSGPAAAVPAAEPGDRAEGNAIFEGRLTAYVESRAWDPTLTFQLCGSASMIVEVRDILIAKGVPHERIISEVYF